MIMIDASVLIDWFKNVKNEKTLKLDDVILTNLPFAISVLTYQELLQKVRDEREYNKLKLYLNTQRIFYLPDKIKFYDIATNIHRKLRADGKTDISTIDILIATQSMYYKAPLLHNSKDFTLISKYIDDFVCF